MTREYVYLDYAATTPLDARVAARLASVAAEHAANPSSQHRAGRAAAAVVEDAARQLGALLGVCSEQLLWTSGATESNNLAIVGTARQRAHRGRHLVSMRTEHKAVVDVLRTLEKRGFEVSWLPPEADGRLPAKRLQDALRDDTQLVSIMHVNNETGAVQDIASLGAVCRDRGVPFHVDGAQAAGKVPVNLGELPVDLYSVTAHKFYGPKGIGALYLADGVVLEALMSGGGQQRRLRPGTLPTPLIAGLGEAAAVAAREIETELPHLEALRSQLLDGIGDIGGLQVNSPPDGYPGILNVGVDDIEGESLLLALEPLCVATGSACNAQSNEPSAVLRALGRSDVEAQSAIRFSFGRATTAGDIDFAITAYRRAVEKLRALAPAA